MTLSHSVPNVKNDVNVTRKSKEPCSRIVSYCFHCREKMPANRRSKRYCSNACKQAEFRFRNNPMLTKREAKMRKKISKNKHCLHCGNAFTNNPHGRPKKFCQPSCKVIYFKLRRTATQRAIKSIPNNPLPVTTGIRLLENDLIARGYSYQHSIRAWVKQDGLL